MVRKDLALFFADRRALVMAFAAPIAIASFFGSMFPGGGGPPSQPSRIAIHVVDEDGSVISKAIVADLQADAALKVTRTSAGEAWEAVKRGRSAVAVSLPRGFGEGAGRAFFGERAQLTSPPRARELPWCAASHRARRVSWQMVRAGLLAEHVMRAVTTEVAGVRYRRPFEVREEAMAVRVGTAYNGYAHAFAGMGVQFLLFASIDLGVGVLLERQRGLWKRLRSAPISRWGLLAGKAASGTVIALLTLLVSFAFAMLAFGVRIEGSVVGFLAVALACALMAASFGLFVAAVGNTPGTTRGVATLVVLIMVMLGGAWVPTFVFPAWLQQLTVVMPTRWAVDGLDAMTWRGLGLDAAMAPVGVLIAFAAAFWILAVARFRWEER